MDNRLEILNNQIETICNELISEKGSNKKARKYLREQLWFPDKKNTHELIKLMINKLEQIALDI